MSADLQTESTAQGTEGATPHAASIRSSAIRSVKWSATSRVCVQLLQFATQIALARLLTPSAFGYAAIAVFVANFALLLSDLGIGSALIHGAEVSEKRLNTAFWFNAILGFVFAALVMCSAGPITQILQQPAAAGPMRVSGLTCAIAVYAVPLALLERRLHLRGAAMIEVTSAIVGSACGVVLALLGTGVYAIVAVPLCTAFSNSVLFLAVTRFRPTGFIDATEASLIYRYIRGLVGFNIINYFTRNTDNVLIARFGTPAQLGLYSRAFSLMLLPVAQIQTVFGRVLFPAFARLRDDPARLRSAHRRSLLLSSMVCAPLSVGAAATSADLVVTLFGHDWAPMAPMLTILSITGVQQVYQGTAGMLYQATGQTGRMFRWNLLFTALTILAFLIGIRWGAIGICWAVFVRGWVLLPITLLIPLHLIGERLRSIAVLLMPLTVCLVLEAGAAYGAFWLLVPVVHFAPLRLVVEVFAGAVVYVGAIRFVQPGATRELAGMVMKARAGRG